MSMGLRHEELLFTSKDNQSFCQTLSDYISPNELSQLEHNELYISRPSTSTAINTSATTANSSTTVTTVAVLYTINFLIFSKSVGRRLYRLFLHLPLYTLYYVYQTGITWVLVYRTDKYKRLKAEVEKQSKKLEKKKETITESAGRQQKKKIERQEEKLKNNNRDLSMVRMKSMFAIGFCFTALMGMFNSIFDGRVVAKLPFTPLSYIQGLSHRNLSERFE
ncbi:calcium load-activated calcium channel-like [Sminthopsis crassicaudata]|uniref:calcium load-activated calcium channel-like n=1 Tax=Sminthopsis crassicaudata TaxID=9301 RepID=UPI003D69DFA7